jgi:predicted ATP-dependent protease
VRAAAATRRRARAAPIEVLGQTLSLISTVSLEPEPIPLDVKVVLLGERLLYYTLFQQDPDFAELFKVAADFEEQMDRTPETHLDLLREADYWAGEASHAVVTG